MVQCAGTPVAIVACDGDDDEEEDEAEDDEDEDEDVTAVGGSVVVRNGDRSGGAPMIVLWC